MSGMILVFSIVSSRQAIVIYLLLKVLLIILTKINVITVFLWQLYGIVWSISFYFATCGLDGCMTCVRFCQYIFLYLIH